jgi:hypothetical protein
MPRHARLDAEGTLHHIIVHGIERRLIFRDDTSSASVRQKYPAARAAQFLNMTPPAVGYAVERGERIVNEKGYVL